MSCIQLRALGIVPLIDQYSTVDHSASQLHIITWDAQITTYGTPTDALYICHVDNYMYMV